jgi:hypothetical protein
MSKSLNAMQWSMAVVLLLVLSLIAAFALPLGGGPQGIAKMTIGDILEVYRRRDRLDSDRVLVQQSNDRHRDSLTRLMEGRLSLAEATATLYQDIDSLPPRLNPKQPLSFAAVRDEEGRMRMTIDWVETLLVNHPRSEEIRARLQRELQAFCEAKNRCTPQPSERRPCGPFGVPMKVATSAQE